MIRSTTLRATVLLIAFYFFVYRSIWHVPFYFDDYVHYVENLNLRHSQSIQGVLFNGLQGTRPIYNLFLGLYSKTIGLNLKALHASSMILHLSLAFTMFKVLRLLQGSFRNCFFASTLFLVHPLCIQSVVYFNSQSGLLSQLFGWLALYFYLEQRWPYFLCLIAAIASKEDGAAFALILPFIQIWRESSGQGQRINSYKTWTPLLSLATVPILYIVFKNPHAGTIGSGLSMSMWQYLWNQGSFLPLHLSRFFMFGPHTIYWDVPSFFSNDLVVFSGWILLCILFFLSYFIRRHSFVLFFACAFLALLPTHSVVPLLDVHASRIWFPMLPWMSAGLISAIFYFESRLSKYMFFLGLCLIFFVCSWLTSREVTAWTNPLALAKQNTIMAPSRWQVWDNYSVELAMAKNYPESFVANQKAIELSKRDPETLYNLSALYFVSSDHREDLLLARSLAKEAILKRHWYQRPKKLIQKIDQKLLKIGAQP